MSRTQSRMSPQSSLTSLPSRFKTHCGMLGVLLPLLAVPAFAQDAPATTEAAPATAATTTAASTATADAPTADRLPESTAPNGAGETPLIAGASVTARPGKRLYVTPDLKVALVGATLTSGDADQARRALAASFAAIDVLPGYMGIPLSDVASAMQNLKGDAMRVPEFQYLGKRLKAARALTVTVRPGAQTDTSAEYTAIAELYDTQSGGLVGRSEKTYVAGPDNALPARTAESTVPAANIARGNLVEDNNGTLQERGIDGAVARAIFGLNDPIQLRGVVVSKPGAYQARISLGEKSGLRTGAPVEYFSNGERIGYGTVIDLGAGESVATVAPEAAFGNIYVNCEVRNVDNPSPARAGASQSSKDDREWRRFERDFGLAIIPALAISLATTQ